MRLRTLTLLRAAGLVLCLLACALAAVGLSAYPSGSSREARGTVVHVTVRDFHIKVEPGRIPAGDARLVIVIKGPDTHEPLVVRGDSALPRRKDGLTVDEDSGLLQDSGLPAQCLGLEVKETTLVEEGPAAPGRVPSSSSCAWRASGSPSMTSARGSRPSGSCAASGST